MIDYFKNMTDTISFNAGEIIFDVNQPGETMFVIRSGSVDIKKHDTVVATLNEGEYFGEMALIDKAIRSASAVAKTDVELIEVDKRRFLFLVQQTQTFALQVMSTMAERLRHYLDEEDEMMTTDEFKTITED